MDEVGFLFTDRWNGNEHCLCVDRADLLLVAHTPRALWYLAGRVSPKVVVGGHCIGRDLSGAI